MFGKYNNSYDIKDKSRIYGAYHPNSSLEKYGGEVSTLAQYCSSYHGSFRSDWLKENIEYSEANTRYAVNVIKSYASKRGAKDEIVASYCALYILNHSDRFDYKCTSSKIWFDYDDCTVSFCKREGICCLDKGCGGESYLLLWLFVPFFLLFLLVVAALGTRKRRRY